ncbi:acyl-CoA thioesterase FadM [Okibacterium sp. HSC-33S16]|uniref:thioesterase family protein n=1 Tax=Okibacterium sp. HSC-33S16 TaxID=2910965 RepID=UPI00209CBE79|nr:thioesterase family protein [Okibacterium sp. HSC-33S16]MCP2032177.1 acyl-CoA thioesterase FadM [Okibacterium sp. HSC-33S16]
MNLLWRTILHFWVSKRAHRRATDGLHPYDVYSTSYRVLPTDIDILGHMNNGRYLSIADLGRFDMLVRSGLWQEMKRVGWYPVVQSLTISYRKSLLPWKKFDVESRFIGYDDRAVYVEQRFVFEGEIYARLHMKGRFLKRSGGSVSIEEIQGVVGDAPHDVELDDWIHTWASDVSLPSPKRDAPSEWHSERPVHRR